MSSSCHSVKLRGEVGWERVPVLIGRGEHIRDETERARAARWHPTQGTHKTKRCQRPATAQSGREIRVDKWSPWGGPGQRGVHLHSGTEIDLAITEQSHYCQHLANLLVPAWRPSWHMVGLIAQWGAPTPGPLNFHPQQSDGWQIDPLVGHEIKVLRNEIWIERFRIENSKMSHTYSKGGYCFVKPFFKNKHLYWIVM